MSSSSSSRSLSPRHRTVSLAASESATSAPRVSSPLINSAATADDDANITFSPTTIFPDDHEANGDDDGESSDDDDEPFPSFDHGKARGQAPSSMTSPGKHRLGTNSTPSIIINPTQRGDGGTGSFGGSDAGGSTRSLPFLHGSEVTLKAADRGRTLAPTSPKSRDPSPAPSATTLDASWWGDHDKKESVLPWKEDRPKRNVSIPAEQLQGMEHTKQRVEIAARSVLGGVHDVSYELLKLGVEFLDLVPIPGLAPAGKMLLSIWDAVQNVDVNFYGCLRLTERCANILISIRLDIHEAGDEVGIELAAPISKLEETFESILLFMQKQVRRPFLKRYLKRDEIQYDLKACNDGLNDALALFSISVQTRTLHQVQETARKQREDMQGMINAMVAGGLLSSNALQSHPSLLLGAARHDEPLSTEVSKSQTPTVRRTKSTETITRFITTANVLGLVDEQNSTTPSNVLSLLSNLQQDQNSIDSTRDFTEIRNLMRKAIQAPNDAEMLQVLQVRDDQMPEAIKTLQRALEKVQGHGGIVPEELPPGLIIGKVKRSVSVKEGGGKQGGGLKRSRTTISIESAASSNASNGSISGGSGSGGSSGSGSSRKRDTLDQEFIETGISALMRMSRGRETNLPSWTITKFEVNREKQIGVGGFSKVYRGTWNGRTVALKVLKMKVPKKLFVREVNIWRKLHHRNIVELYGASSANDPPWFFVCPYMKHGNLVDYLRKVEGALQKASVERARSRSKSPTGSSHLNSDAQRTATFPLPGFKPKPDLAAPVRESTLPLPVKQTADGGLEIRKEWDLFRFMLEIAEGMLYLHTMGVLHGDLKASNVLVDDHYTCVISDFGQSEIKSEAYRMSGEPIPHQGTMRWQAPEILTGMVEMTKETDVYAFSIAVVEIVNMGKLPWGIMLEDEAIRQRVLKDNGRPKMNESPFNTPSLQEIVKLCWHRDPTHRPQFSKIVRDLERLQKSFGKGYESPKRALATLVEDHATPASPSPDMKPFPLPSLSPPAPAFDILQWDADKSRPHLEETVATADIKMPEPVTWTSNVPSKKRKDPAESGDAEDFDVLDLDDDAESLAPTDEKVLEMKNELRYRLLLNHQFHPSLILPLWQPSPDVQLGAVGYLEKPTGRFVTLFNAFKPVRSSVRQVQTMPSIDGYGKVTEGNQKQDKLNIIQRGMDSVVGFISRNKSDGSIPIRRRHTFDLRAGHKAAHLYTESTDYRYLDKLDAPKMWFARNIDTILKIFGKEHHLQREDIILVVGALRTPNYGLFVSHSHPDGHAHFNVYASPKQGHPWGTFTTDSEASREGGPSYDETNDSRTRVEASKVSTHGGSWDTVLIARLRFKPDATEPTAK